MGKKNKNKAHTSPMKEWSKDASVMVPYDDLIAPLRRIVDQGYKLTRYTISHFNYTGYNIGKKEQGYSPTPIERLNERWLDNEDKNNRTLIDNVLCIAFQLGMEQGRRMEWNNRYNNQLLIDVIGKRTERIRELEDELAKYEPETIARLRLETPLISHDANLLIDTLEDDEEIEVTELESKELKEAKEEITP